MGYIEPGVHIEVTSKQRPGTGAIRTQIPPSKPKRELTKTRIDVYETLCSQQMLVHKGGKLRTGVGSAEMSHLQNCSLKIYLKRALGVGLGGSGWM